MRRRFGIVGGMSVVPGLTRLLASRRLEGLRAGLVCNPASVDAALAHASDLVFGAPGVTLAALFGPQHGFRADLQDNMIESPHASDAIRRVPVYSLYSETREPTAEMLRGLDVLVVDLQDVGARIYTFVYTMANCLRAAARHKRPGHRVRPPESDRRRGGRRADARAGVRVVRRALPHPHAPRDDHRRARGAVQHAVRHRRGPPRRPDGGLVARDVLRRDRPAVGHAVAEHAHARHGHRLSRRGAVRGHAAVRGPRHDAAVRAAGRAVDRRGAVLRRT